MAIAAAMSAYSIAEPPDSSLRKASSERRIEALLGSGRDRGVKEAPLYKRGPHGAAVRSSGICGEGHFKGFLLAGNWNNTLRIRAAPRPKLWRLAVWVSPWTAGNSRSLCTQNVGFDNWLPAGRFSCVDRRTRLRRRPKLPPAEQTETEGCVWHARSSTDAVTYLRLSSGRQVKFTAFLT